MLTGWTNAQIMCLFLSTSISMFFLDHSVIEHQHVARGQLLEKCEPQDSTQQPPPKRDVELDRVWKAKADEIGPTPSTRDAFLTAVGQRQEEPDEGGEGTAKADQVPGKAPAVSQEEPDTVRGTPTTTSSEDEECEQCAPIDQSISRSELNDSSAPPGSFAAFLQARSAPPAAVLPASAPPAPVLPTPPAHEPVAWCPCHGGDPFAKGSGFSFNPMSKVRFCPVVAGQQPFASPPPSPPPEPVPSAEPCSLDDLEEGNAGVGKLRQGKLNRYDKVKLLDQTEPRTSTDEPRTSTFALELAIRRRGNCQRACAVIVRISAWMLHAMVDGMVLASAPSTSVLIATSVPVTFCSLQVGFLESNRPPTPM